ncbi:MAG: hypothetical protein K9J16_09325 [Melioribacteraceae bacterium]|nr:hypothetical protein [Melioribacteraceae bacterium]MCF8355994.1 hypothetical protein [Melioribacteraceae bacterium]MCF8396108.1 hypothetical protein [Melioribacteraceae bacterium]MCF8419597.1 hypothetical protein [Melioribacteraceae bacterium]
MHYTDNEIEKFVLNERDIVSDEHLSQCKHCRMKFAYWKKFYSELEIIQEKTETTNLDQYNFNENSCVYLLRRLEIGDEDSSKYTYGILSLVADSIPNKETGIKRLESFHLNEKVLINFSYDMIKDKIIVQVISDDTEFINNVLLIVYSEIGELLLATNITGYTEFNQIPGLDFEKVKILLRKPNYTLKLNSIVDINHVKDELRHIININKSDFSSGNKLEYYLSVTNEGIKIPGYIEEVFSEKFDNVNKIILY